MTENKFNHSISGFNETENNQTHTRFPKTVAVEFNGYIEEKISPTNHKYLLDA